MDIFLIQEAMLAHKLELGLKVMRDGEEATHFLAALEGDTKSRCPSVILLDLNLPRATGFEVLASIRGNGRCAAVPVVVMTSSGASRDRETSRQLGANAYFCKPAGYDEFLAIGGVIREVLA